MGWGVGKRRSREGWPQASPTSADTPHRRQRYKFYFLGPTWDLHRTILLFSRFLVFFFYKTKDFTTKKFIFI